MNTLATLIFPNLVNRPSNSTDEKIICPLCGDDVEKLVYRFHYESEQHVINKIKENNPSWSEKDGACSRCIDYYHVKLEQEDGLIPEAGSHFKVNAADDFVIIPTPLRLDANATFTGKGVTICFIDSGFTLHPDLVKNKIFKAKVVKIYPSLNTDNHSVKVDAEFIGEEPPLLANATIEANILIKTKNNALVIPKKLIKGTDSLKVIQNGKEEYIRIKQGIETTDEVEILSGLNAQTQIVSE